MEETASNNSFKDKYDDSLERFKKISAEISEFEKANNLLDNEIVMLEYEKEYLLDILCEIDEQIRSQQMFVKACNQMPKHGKKLKKENSTTLIEDNSKKILGVTQDFLAKKAYFQCKLNEDYSESPRTPKREEEEQKEWDSLPEEKRNEFRNLVSQYTPSQHSQKSPLPDSTSQHDN
ncbi:hypothetical protein WA158_001797 [Blastocystis sp. Blastoise]